MPKFSIIVPCYNLKTWIRECLDSVLSQSFTDWECVVIDDESTDGSGEILDEYAAKDDRFKIIHQKNAGEGGARNAGLAVAKGEWVFFLDGDDVMLECALTRLVECMSSVDSIIRFGYLSFDDGDSLPMSSECSKGTSHCVDISKEIMMQEFFTYVWQHIYRRSDIVGMQFKKYKRGCDRVFLSDVLLNRVDKVKVVDYVCYGYRKRMGSAMNVVPSELILCDEMDHRLDIMKMIDASEKDVKYRGSLWLEYYFIGVCYYYISSKMGVERKRILSQWRNRLRRLCAVNGLSSYGYFVAWSCSKFGSCLWDGLVCNLVPRFVRGIRKLSQRI